MIDVKNKWVFITHTCKRVQHFTFKMIQMIPFHLSKNPISIYVGHPTARADVFSGSS